jgi:2-methylcitrate dehydratase PrpD
MQHIVRYNENNFAIAKFFLAEPNERTDARMAVGDSITGRLAEFCVSTNLSGVADEAVERATVSLIHNFTVALAGRSREKHCHVLATRYWNEPREATLLHSGLRVSAEGAAFANGALMHVRSQDDTHAASTSHPGTPVMAAALAVAEAGDCTGAEFLEAVILGYEILCRVGRDFDNLVSGRGFRAASVFGGFGAAAAAAKLMHLSAEQMAHAIALSAQFAGGLLQVWEEGSAEFPLQLGMSARNGIVAARAAASGVTAAREMLEGKGGFFRAFAGVTGPASEVMEGLGRRWQLSEVTVKPYPVCAILQGPVESTIALVQEGDIAPADVRNIELTLSPYEASYPGIDNPGPFGSATATKMSAQFALASSVLRRRLTMDDIAAFNSSETLALSRKVEVVADPSLPDRLSRLTVVLADGRKLVRRVDKPAGKPSLAEVCAFARVMHEEVGVSPSRMERMAQAICDLRGAPSVAGLIDCLRP